MPNLTFLVDVIKGKRKRGNKGIRKQFFIEGIAPIIRCKKTSSTKTGTAN